MNVWTNPLKRRWLVWGALAGVFLLVNIYRLSTAVLAESLMATFQTTGAELGTLHASFFYIYAILQIPAGVIADRVGVRRTATYGAVTLNVGAVAFALSDTYLAAFLARTLIGLGGSVVYISILRFCANWFRADEFATINGVTIAVAGMGGILATRPLAELVVLVGWRTAILGFGFVGIAFSVFVYVLTRDTPKKAGLQPIDGVPSPPEVTMQDVVSNVRTVLRERETWLISVILFCATGINITLLGLWGVPYVVQTYDVSVVHASQYTLLGSVGLMVGPPTIGWLSDHIERRTVIMVAGAGLYTAAFTVLAVTGAPPRAVVAAVFFVVAFLAGASMLGYTVVKERHSSSASGTATGTVNGAAFFGAAVFPTAMGAALDAFWTGETVAGARVYTVYGYRVAFGIAAAAAFLAFTCSVWLHLRETDAAVLPLPSKLRDLR